MNSSNLSENQLSPKNEILGKTNDNKVFTSVNKLSQDFDKNLPQIRKKRRSSWKIINKVCETLISK